MSGALQNTRAVVSGTKTGGHLHPAVSVGRQLAGLGMDVTLVSSGAPTEDLVLQGLDLPVRVLEVARIKGAGTLAKVRGMAGLPAGMLRAARLLREIKPDIVVGFGGFTTGPLLLAAALMRIPTAICEENSIPGLTNRILARFVSRIFVTYEETRQRLPGRAVVVTGTPVRPEILDVAPRSRTGEVLRILVLGGSQGSAFLNGRMPPVLALVKEAMGGLEVLHQTGKGRHMDVREAYDTLGVKAEVVEYLRDMDAAYGRVDFVVCRSGAGTVAEISVIGLPALFVPFAAAADNHQVANARPLVEAGGSLMVEEGNFDEESVALEIGDVLADEARMEHMAEVSRSWGRRDALDRVVEELVDMVAA